MEVQVQFVQLKRSESLEQFINESLEKINKKFNDITNIIVKIKKGNGNDDESFICVMEVRLPGEPIFAESKEHKYEAAISETISDIERQLTKRKGKLQSY